MVHIVLVHGAIADGTSWQGVIPILQAQGYKCSAVQQPLSSIPDDIAKVQDHLALINEPVVLVGHSFGGIVISNAGNADNVKALVYVAAFAPDEGQTAADLGQGYKPLISNQSFQADAKGRVYLKQDDYVKYFCPDIPEKQAKIAAAVQGLSDGARFAWKSGSPAWKKKPSYYIVAEGDQIIQPELEADLAKRIHAVKTVSIPGASHACMLSHPDKVAALILEAAKAVHA